MTTLELTLAWTIIAMLPLWIIGAFIFARVCLRNGGSADESNRINTIIFIWMIVRHGIKIVADLRERYMEDDLGDREIKYRIAFPWMHRDLGENMKRGWK